MDIALRHKDVKRSNRTFMELKREDAPCSVSWLPSSNRTFMELKRVKPAYNSLIPGSSNRTFMELKQNIQNLF